MTAPTARPIAAVLWDCDGVLQHGVRGVLSRLTERAGPETLPALLEAERPALRGDEPVRDAVRRVIADLGLDCDVEDLVHLWDHYRLDEDALAVLAAVRRRGIACYLATNQHDYRRDRMRTVSGYDDLVDGSFYSCEMRTAKPDPAFFRYIVTALSLPAEQLLFLDDVADNVTAARAEGLHAELIGPPPVAPQLTRILARYQVLPAA